MRPVVRSGIALVVASALWLPALQLWFARSPEALAEPLGRRVERAFDAPAGELRGLRASNPEWDLMARLFGVLAFANLALAEPARRAEHLARIDRILADTIAADESGARHYLMAYGQTGAFRDDAQRSLFADGELALMLVARQAVEPSPRWTRAAHERVERIAAQVERAPVLAGESYPDEGWLFCNTVALAALRIHGGHDALLARWVATARERLVDRSTGLLVSSFTWDGAHRDGPEGSSIWFAAHMLQIVDAELAGDQYRRAKAELAGGTLGFAWAREWPASWRGHADVDSGPTVPVIGASAGSSGLALVAARAFADADFAAGLIASMQLAAFPIEGDDDLRYAAGNMLADAVVLYALVAGPLWQQVQQ